VETGHNSTTIVVVVIVVIIIITTHKDLLNMAARRLDQHKTQ